MTDRDEGRMEAAERLRAYVRTNGQGGCRMLSEGDDCKCPLCDIDRLLRAEPSGDVGKEAERALDAWRELRGARKVHGHTVALEQCGDALAAILARLRRTPEAERRRPVWQTGGWKEAVMDIVDPNEERPTAEVLEIVNAIADATARLADPNAGGEE